MKRVKQLAAGFLLGVFASLVIVGASVAMVGFGLERVGRTCRLGRHVGTDLANGFALIGLAVSGVAVIAFMVESWKHERVPEVTDLHSFWVILGPWFFIANGLVLLLIATSVGCGVLSLIR